MALPWVPNPARAPHRCWFLPTIAGFHPKGFVQGGEVDGLTAYVSIEAVEQIATAMGWAPRVLGDRQVQRLKDRVTEIEAEVADRDRRLAAYSVLHGEVPAVPAKRGPGRPRKTAV